MDSRIQPFSWNLAKQMIPEIKNIVEIFKKDPERGFNFYCNFIEKWKPSIEKIVLEGLKDPIELGYISSRLLRDPIDTALTIKEEKRPLEEIESQIVGYLKAILGLIYYCLKGLEGWQYSGSIMHEKTIETQNIWKVDVINSFLQIIKAELDEIKLPEESKSDREIEIITDHDNLEININNEQNYGFLYTDTENEKTDIPFTARILAYYRAQELRRESPLIIDPYAKDLAGDMTSYIEKHQFIAKRSDYPIVRSYYIDENLLKPWCNQKKTQIVILGAGLDTRAYRFLPVMKNDHTIFEIDFKNIIEYKEKILIDKKPLCNLIRVATDLSQSDWKSHIIKSGYSSEIPTFWILEGLVYYIDRNTVKVILKNLTEISHNKSSIFVDVCVPALANLVFGPFTKYFKWGIHKNHVPQFFAETGWEVFCSYADNHDLGRDVGQRGLMFIQGKIR